MIGLDKVVEDFFVYSKFPNILYYKCHQGTTGLSESLSFMMVIVIRLLRVPKGGLFYTIKVAASRDEFSRGWYLRLRNFFVRLM